MKAENETLAVLKFKVRKIISRRRRWSSFDFRIAHVLFWTSILASFSSSIIIASKTTDILDPIYLAILAGIPGLVVSIENNFDFARRSAWGVAYEIELQKLLNQVEFEKINSYDATVMLTEIIKRNEELFHNIGFFKRPHGPDQR